METLIINGKEIVLSDSLPSDFTKFTMRGGDIVDAMNVFLERYFGNYFHITECDVQPGFVCISPEALAYFMRETIACLLTGGGVNDTLSVSYKVNAFVFEIAVGASHKLMNRSRTSFIADCAGSVGFKLFREDNKSHISVILQSLAKPTRTLAVYAYSADDLYAVFYKMFFGKKPGGV